MRPNVRSLWESYWPLAVLPMAAGLLDLLLWTTGQAWSWSDWAANFGLGAVTTMVVGMLLARRQGRLQEAVADLQLTEKVAILTSAVPLLRRESRPERTHRSMYDCRAGMSLVPLARAEMQEEYLRTVVRVLAAVEHSLGSSLHAHIRWTADDWADLAEAVDKLLATTAAMPGAASGAAAWTTAIGEHGRGLRGIATGAVPFSLFRSHFTSGPDRIRTSLDWDVLAALDARGDGSVRLEKTVVQVPPYGLERMADYYAPWYRRGRGETSHDDPDAVPLRIAGAASDLSLLTTVRRARIHELRRHYAGQDGPAHPSLLLATYALNDRDRLVLDGNHRMTALALLTAQGCPATLTEICLHAPLDPAILPDLARHLPAPAAPSAE